MKKIISIDRRIPVPIKATGKNKGMTIRYPLHFMKVGDSFLIPKGRKDISFVAHFNINHPKTRFTTRKIRGRIRIWRIK